MLLRRLLTAVPMSVVVLFAGVAFAGGPVTADVQMMDFTSSTDLLLAYPHGHALGYYKHTDRTQHLPGVFGPHSTHGTHGVPPNPCDGLTHAWNHLIREGHPDSLRAQMVILAVMARAQCNAVVVTDTTQSPPVLVSITPSPT